MTFLDNLKEATTVGTTENGAKTFTSTLNANLDFFSLAGAMRDRGEAVGTLFAKAYAEDKEVALRNLVHMRNIRLGGVGERDAFRVSFKKVIDNDPDVAVRFMPYIAHIGRWDDVVAAYDYVSGDVNNRKVKEAALEVISHQLTIDIENLSKEGESISLLGKWIPSTSVKSPERKVVANKLAADLGFGHNHKEYRKILAMLRTRLGLVEKDLANKNYDNIDFTKLPSKALFKYRAAFYRHLPEQFEAFIERVNDGEIKLNASNVLPYEILRSYDSNGWGGVGDYNSVLEATWKSLPDYLEGIENEQAIVVADTSGSMIGDPMHVSVSLALYCAEKLQGPYKDNFITFSKRPQLVTVSSELSLHDRLEIAYRSDWGMNTDLQAVFQLILDTAVANNTPQEELPSKLIIVSDMEFDYSGAGDTNFEAAKKKFAAYGYPLPDVAFWNVNARQENTPVRFNQEGVALVSGLTPTIFTGLLKGKFDSPVQVMMDTLDKEAYDFVTSVLNK